jgi:hypothetical protein
MIHVADEGAINRVRRQFHRTLGAKHRLHIGEAFGLGARANAVEESRHDVHGNHLSFRPDRSRKQRREQSRARADVRHHHAGLEARGRNDGFAMIINFPPLAFEALDPLGDIQVRLEILRVDPRFGARLRHRNGRRLGSRGTLAATGRQTRHHQRESCKDREGTPRIAFHERRQLAVMVTGCQA